MLYFGESTLCILSCDTICTNLCIIVQIIPPSHPVQYFLPAGGPCQITFLNTSTSATATMEADVVVMASNLKHSATLITDLQAEELDALAGMEEHLLVTTLYEADPEASASVPVQFWFSRMTPNATRDGLNSGARLCGQVNEEQLHVGKQYQGTGKQRRVSYQWMEGVSSSNLTQWNETWQQDIAMLKATNVQVLAQNIWQYFPHFNDASLKKLNPWRILKMQGKRNTIWIGSSVGLETVFGVLNYNVRLEKRIVME